MPESNEKRFRRIYRAALADLGPLLHGLGFEGDKGEYFTPWNDELSLAVSIRESKWNKFGATRFDVIPTVLMMENMSRRVRWIWKPIHEQDGAWRFESDEAIEGLGQRMTDAVLRSAVPLALGSFGPPSNGSLAVSRRGIRNALGLMGAPVRRE